jgi:hypothetical protein
MLIWNEMKNVGERQNDSMTVGALEMLYNYINKDFIIQSENKQYVQNEIKEKEIGSISKEAF